MECQHPRPILGAAWATSGPSPDPLREVGRPHGGPWTVARPVTCARRRSQPTRRGSSPAFAPPPTGLPLARRFSREISLERERREMREKKFTHRSMRAGVSPVSGVGRAPWSTVPAVTRCPSPVTGRSRVLRTLAAAVDRFGGGDALADHHQLRRRSRPADGIPASGSELKATWPGTSGPRLRWRRHRYARRSPRRPQPRPQEPTRPLRQQRVRSRSRT
jgi:hypothetical protein